jgi:CrcB protein
MTVLLVALGAGVGAALRFMSASWLDRPGFAWGTWAVNLTGSCVIGVVVGAGAGAHATALLATGLCGGLTTYSSFAVQTHERGPRRGGLYAAATLLPALGACALGFALGAWLW